MIISFRHKGLEELFETGKTARIDSRMHARIKRRLDALNTANQPLDMSIPGFNFHQLQGFEPPRYSVHVNGPWAITFGFEGENAAQVDFENYH
jgi:proteic killer suppression protein